MRNLVSRKLLWPAIMLIALACFTGCAGMDRYLPAEAPKLTAEQEIEVGAVAGDRLLQLLGGPHHDKALAEEIESLVKLDAEIAGRLTVSLADKSAAALYVLPGDRVVLTRGLLSEIRDLGGLKALLQHAAALTRTGSSVQANRASNQATMEILSTKESVYDSESGSIRLARIFAERPCEGNCIKSLLISGVNSSKDVPESIRLLKELQPAYASLAEAQRLERADNFSQAIIYYLKAATMAPDEPHILGSLGMAYLRAGELQTARLNLQKAVKLQPDYYKTRMGLGYLYLQQGQVRKANNQLAESVRLLPVTENLFLLAEAREKGGDAEGSMSLYRLIIEKDPQSKLGRTAASRLARSQRVQ